MVYILESRDYYMLRLKELRKSHKMSQTELSQKLGVTQATLSGWENEKFEIDNNSLIKCSEIFNVSTDYLLGRNYSTTNSSDEPQLTSRDKKQIENILENTRQQLLSQDGLMFEGSPATEEDVQKVLIALQMGMEMIKKENKEKYTPKKYRK